MAPRRAARIEVTAAPAVSASSSLRLQRSKSSRLGLVLALLGLLAQIAGPGLHPSALISSANAAGKLAIAFDAHALCRSPGSTVPSSEAPADKAPKAHHDFAACCFWHGSVGAVLASAALIELIAFAPSRVAFTAPPADIPTRLSGAVRARAPPAGA